MTQLAQGSVNPAIGVQLLAGSAHRVAGARRVAAPAAARFSWN